MKITDSSRTYTIIPTATVRDERLSYAARGLLFYLLSLPDGTEVTADDLSLHARRHRKPQLNENRIAIRDLFAELQRHGYMTCRRVRRDGGFETLEVVAIYDTSQGVQDDPVAQDSRRLRAVE